VEEHVTFRRDHVEDQVALTDRASTREHEHVFLQTLIHRAREVVERVGDVAIRNGDAAVVRDDSRNRELIDVVNLSRCERLARVDDFVPGRQNGDSRPRIHLDIARSKCGHGADAARCQPIAGPQHVLAGLNIRALTANVLSRVDRCENSDPITVGIGLLDDDHRVGTRGHRRTGRNLDTFPGRERVRRDLACEELLDAAKDLRLRVRGAKRVFGADRIAIHARARERRHVDIGHDVARQHATVGIEQSDTFDPLNRTNRVVDDLLRLVEWNRVADRSHGRNQDSGIWNQGWSRIQGSGIRPDSYPSPQS
jgi:hypothetical protein